jgi:HIRAN domain
MCNTGAMKTIISQSLRKQLPACLADLPLIPASSLVPRPRVRDEGPKQLRTQRAGEICADFNFQLSDFRFAQTSFPIAGFQHHDDQAALAELQPGTALTLRAQPDNPHDPNAVEILHGALKLGYVPRFCNRQLSELLQSEVLLTCEVARITADAPPWDAVAVRISLPQAALEAA